MKAGWETKRLGEIIQLEYGKPLADSDRNPNGLYPAYGANGIKDRTDKFYRGEPSIIVGRKGSAGEVTLTEEKYWPLDVTFFVEFDRAKYELQYLYFLLLTLNLPSMAKGVKPGINRNDVYDITVTTPDIVEQRRIVTLLDEAFADIATAKANAEKNLQNARGLFESHLDAIVTSAQANGEIVPLSELATDITDGDHMPPPKVEQGLPFITIGNIDKQTRAIDFSDTFQVPREYFDGLKPNKKPMRGDVLYTVTGSFGIPVLVEDDKEFCFQRHIGLIRPKADVDSTWLHYLLQSPQVFNQAADGATGTAQKTVSLKVLRNLQVPKISPTLQSAHVETLRSVETECRRLESIYRQKLTALDDLKKSLLHQAFSGQL